MCDERGISRIRARKLVKEEAWRMKPDITRHYMECNDSLLQSIETINRSRNEIA